MAGSGLNGRMGDRDGAGDELALEVFEGLFMSFAELIDIAAALALCSVDTETAEREKAEHVCYQVKSR